MSNPSPSPFRSWAGLRAGLFFLPLAWALAAPGSAAAAEPAAADLQAWLVAPPDPLEHGRRLEQARGLFEAQEWAEAEAILAELAAAYPLHGPTWGQLAVARRRQDKHAVALAAYDRVLALQGPGLPYDARYWSAVLQAKLGRTDAALATLEKLVHEDAWLQRPGLPDDPNLAALAKHPRLLALAGREDVSGLDRVAGWRMDVDHLVAEIVRNDPGAAPLPPELALRAEALKAAVPTLSDAEVVAGLGRVLHTLGRGHTALWLGAPPSRLAFKPMPLRLYLFPEGLFITRGSEGQEDLWAGRIRSFDGVPAGEALARVAAATSSESAMETVWVAPYFLSLPEFLHGLGIARQPDGVELEVELLDGRVVTRRVPTIAGPPSQPSMRLDPPYRGPAPRWLSHNGEHHWLEPLADREALYVQVNNVMADEDETLPHFGLRVRQTIAETKPRRVIVDLRHNNGGNTFTYGELLRTLVAFSTVAGNKVYVLIGRDVYSAAANLTTDLERLVQPIFVGEPTAATGNQWGDESQFVLPWSGVSGAIAGVRWQLSHPWDARRSIVPHVPVQLSARQYFGGHDPALDAVLRMIDEDRGMGPRRQSLEEAAAPGR
jgi:tetratricopeptide (TPR) repeat protein